MRGEPTGGWVGEQPCQAFWLHELRTLGGQPRASWTKLAFLSGEIAATRSLSNSFCRPSSNTFRMSALLYAATLSSKETDSHRQPAASSGDHASDSLRDAHSGLGPAISVPCGHLQVPNMKLSEPGTVVLQCPASRCRCRSSCRPRCVTATCLDPKSSRASSPVPATSDLLGRAPCVRSGKKIAMRPAGQRRVMEDFYMYSIERKRAPAEQAERLS